MTDDRRTRRSAGYANLPPASTLAGRLLRCAVGPRLAAARADLHGRFSYALRHRSSRRALLALHNRHEGEHCFIIGNGPSLNKTNLTLLRHEYTFGLNRINLLFDDLGFHTSCLVAINRLVLEQSGAELARLSLPKFFSTAGAQYIPLSASDVTYIRSTAWPVFSRDPVRRGVWEGATVTFVAMQIAHWMGFRRVVLVGVDHDFATRGPAHQTVTSVGPDSDHFHPEYFGAGYRWQLPDLVTSEIAYRAANDAFHADGREILDATVDGKLTIFPRVRLEDLF